VTDTWPRKHRPQQGDENSRLASPTRSPRSRVPGFHLGFFVRLTCFACYSYGALFSKDCRAPRLHATSIDTRPKRALKGVYAFWWLSLKLPETPETLKLSVSASSGWYRALPDLPLGDWAIGFFQSAPTGCLEAGRLHHNSNFWRLCFCLPAHECLVVDLFCAPLFVFALLSTELIVALF